MVTGGAVGEEVIAEGGGRRRPLLGRVLNVSLWRTNQTEDVSDDDSANSADIVETTLNNAVEKTVATFSRLLRLLMHSRHGFTMPVMLDSMKSGMARMKASAPSVFKTSTIKLLPSGSKQKAYA